MADAYRIGVDIGGTFTDVVLLGSDGTLRMKNVLSTTDNYARGVVPDRRFHPPYGIEGGEAGAPSSNTIRSADGERAVAPMPMEALQLRQGDVFHHVSAGGGGSGSPFERDPALVLEDVLDEKVRVEAARERYGVVIVGGRVDEQATAAARQRRA